MDRLNEIANRKAELKALLESDSVVNLDDISREIDVLEVEERTINEAIAEEQRKANEEAEERKANAEKIATSEVIAEEINLKEKEMEMITRNSTEYVEAYARYIKSGKEEEVRSLLTENVSGGTIAVPDFVLDEIRHAWDNENVMALVHKANLKGNLKVNFEISGTDAVLHTEGDSAVTEEELVEGIATIVPTSIKKWISISDEAYDMRGEAFLRYIYAELGYRIAKKCADTLIAKIVALPSTATSTSPKADKITEAPSQNTIAKAFGHLSDEVTNPVIIMNKLTYATFKGVQYSGNYGTDIFEGLKVVFNNTLPSYDTASANAVYMIVGDLDKGAIANFPNGVGAMEFKFDELSKKKEDMIEILGREYVGLGVVSCGCFTLVAKPSV